MNELQDTLEEIRKIFKCQEDMLDILENEQYRSLLAQKENQKLIETNRKLLAENEKAQNIFREAKTKADCINFPVFCFHLESCPLLTVHLFLRAGVIRLVSSNMSSRFIIVTFFHTSP